MKKIDFKQPKYVFPAVIFIPLCFLVYFIVDMVSGGSNSESVVEQSLNTKMPDAAEKDMGNKMAEMQKMYRSEGSYTAIGSLEEEEKNDELIEQTYSEDELNLIDRTEAERLRQQRQMQELERSLAESRRHINSYSNASSGYDSDDDYMRQMDEIRHRSEARQQMLEERMGINSINREDALEKQRQDSIARAKEMERERNRPTLVLKSQDVNADRFNSVNNSTGNVDAPLIRAMIDQTTKAHEGTRLRFKLLDNITIKDVKIPRGSYLYGTVSGFGQQRVMAKISSILIGNKFIKVDLNVFDNDGMEGFYVPESAFRDFMKDAGASTIQQNIQFDNNSGGYGGISGESIALQALQNLYNSATSAVSANIRKNRAKIKYNTIVYLINSQEAR